MSKKNLEKLEQTSVIWAERGLFNLSTCWEPQQLYLHPDSSLSSANVPEKTVETHNKKTEVKISYKYKTHAHKTEAW